MPDAPVHPSTSTQPRGSVYVEITMSGRWAVSLLTEGWSEDEKAALLRGEEEAVEELKAAAERKVVEQPDDYHADYHEVRFA